MAERTQRLDFRLTSANRKLIERAALLLGQPLTAFAVRTLVEHAQAVIAQDTERKLSSRDWKRFLEIIDDDAVSPTLARAARRFRAKRPTPSR
jgi:uncharacterized protein (DUF1778 family)